ncbi:RsmB/NOP family class I SAM-dependent RNA methyltransferase [Loktanella sp. Alg231-35]|uniref:RsmB/NOP family class I SAM-dependent RNA methyltransferase n=1 Tax=Loktanella sp. Alg231-35 TaxID=1922220 RepID=UPI000D5609DB|nr:RsmB/NOP family class I SAM-dependent RNA methyltransferase [Loktanella sp. Alg231-35]
MTPGARVAAAIAVLDQIADGQPAEQALTAWARASRFAGSKDRAAVRDHVFDVLRARRSLGDGAGRSLMQRLAQREGWDLDALFSGEGHAPTPLTEAERATLAAPQTLADAARCDVPDWLWPQWQDSLGDHAETAALAQQARAEVFLRVNCRKGTTDAAQRALSEDDVATALHDTVAGCLRVLTNPRRVKTARAYLDGMVELQDAASLHAVQQVPVPAAAQLLDYCAGGGGKALAFADQSDAQVFAHDIAPRRMRDLPARAGRAEVLITELPTAALAEHAPFDIVFCDAPCSGSGTWRRTPDAKWRLTQDRLEALQTMQDAVLADAAPLVGPDGRLAYATCSVLKAENDDRIAAFVQANPEWTCESRMQLLPGQLGDGFYLAILSRQNNL